MNKNFQIGNFCFCLKYDEDLVTPPKNLMIFEVGEECEHEFFYEIKVVDVLPRPSGEMETEREDLKVYNTAYGEERFIGIKGSGIFYACYREIGQKKAMIWLNKKYIRDIVFDPVFVSLLSLERRMVLDNQIILHCAYIEYNGKALLFSAPSETGKTTQANLWEKYRGSRTVNGDKALIGKVNGIWTAQGWPVCGTSGCCYNEQIPIHAIVMLSQAEENRVKRIKGSQALTKLYSQSTINRWNREANLKTIDLLIDLLEQIPIYHLECDISESAVKCMEEVLY